MKHLIFTFAFALLTLFASAQYFEGKVVYQNKYTSKVSTVSDAQLASMIGSIQNWYIKGGSYRSETDGTYLIWQIYNNQDNKIYTKTSNSNNVFYSDAAISKSENIDIAITKNALTVLGYDCDQLILTTKQGSVTFYYSSKLPVNSKLFVNHKFGDWYAYLAQANAVPLKMVMETPQMTVISTATEVKPMKLNAAMFTLPAGAEQVKSPF